LFEDLGHYFHDELEYVKDRQGQMRQQMSSLDSVLQEALSNIGISLTNSMQELTTVFQRQNQNIQTLIEEQSNALCESLINQQQVVNEKIGQINEPFTNVSEIFREGISGIRAAFDEQNATIREMLELQSQNLENALNTQNEALQNSLINQQNSVVQKLNDVPDQLQSFSKVGSLLERLNQNIEGLKTNISKPQEIKVAPIMQEVRQKGIVIPALMKWGIPIGLIGTFLALVALIVIQLFDIKL
jgi:hypothetical protein